MRQFLGLEITPLSGTYLVKKDVNVRSLPKTTGKKIGRFEQGERVQIVGKAKGAWLAAAKEGKDFGFVYGPVLLPLLDGVARQRITGRVQVSENLTCDYLIRFDGKTSIDGQEFQSADYNALVECLRENDPLVFNAPMFITEGPIGNGRRRLYQIGIDVLDLVKGYDRFFSTNLLYDLDKGQVRYDSSSIKPYSSGKRSDAADVADVSRALSAGLTLALKAWTPQAWKDLAKALKGETLSITEPAPPPDPTEGPSQSQAPKPGPGAKAKPKKQTGKTDRKNRPGG